MASTVVPSRAKAAARGIVSPAPILPSTAMNPSDPASSSSSSSPSSRNQSETHTYIRLTLLISKVLGDSLSSSPKPYFFRWLRDNKQAKITAARQVSIEHPSFNEKMSLYARVYRPGQQVLAEPGSETLETTIQLVSINSDDHVTTNGSGKGGNQQTVVSSFDFNMGEYIATLTDNSSRSMSETLRFSPDFQVAVTVSIKAIGDNKLKPFDHSSSLIQNNPNLNSPPHPIPESRRLGMRATTPHARDSDEVAAAMELERVRRQNHHHHHLHQQRSDANVVDLNKAIVPSSSGTIPPTPPPSSSDTSSNTITNHSTANAAYFTNSTPMMPVTATPPASFDDSSSVSSLTDVPSLQARVHQLEEELSTKKRDLTQADRKILAHVSHSKKTKEAYTQLASWYNTLRQENIELRKQVPLSGTGVDGKGDNDHTNVEPPRVNSNTSGSTSSYDKVDDEQQLQNNNTSDSSDILTSSSELQQQPSRNSQLLETKARTLAELREQWDSAQRAIEQKEQQLQQNSEEIQNLQQKLELFQSQLNEKDSIVAQRDTELSSTREKIKDMEVSHAQALAEAHHAVGHEGMQKLSSELADLRIRHNEELENVMQKANEETELKLSEFQKQFEREKLEEIEHVRREVETSKAEEMSKLREEYESNLEVEREEALGKVEESKSEVQQWREAANDSEEEVKSLKKALDDIKKDNQRLTELSNDIESRELTLREQVDNLTIERDNLSEQLQGHNDTKLSSPRQINNLETDTSTTTNGSMDKDIKSELENEIAKLETQLRHETERRKEVTSLLDKADREHDELRNMVKRLRQERDRAQEDARVTNERLISIKSNNSGGGNVLSPGRNLARKGSIANSEPDDYEDLVEERDKALFEVFKVRKELNKTIKKLKKENAQLSAKLSSNGANGTDQLNDIADRNVSLPRNGNLSEEVMKIRSERDEALTQLKRTKDELEQISNDYAQGTEREKSAQEKLESLQTEIEAHKIQISDLEISLSEATRNNDSQIQWFEQEKDDLMKKIETSESIASQTAAELARKKSEIFELTERVKSKAVSTEELEQNAAMLARERDMSKNRCEALEKELDALKKSVDDMSSSATSKEDLLRSAQRECSDYLAEITSLKSRLDEMELSSSEVESTLKSDVTKLQSELSKASNASQRFEIRADELEQRAAQYHAQLEIERVKHEKEVAERERVEGLLEDLRTKYSSISVKLSEEQLLRQSAQEEVSSLNEKISELEAFMNDMHDRLSAKDEKLTQSEKEREDAKASLTRLKERLTQVEADAREKDRELKSLQERLTSSESAREILQQRAVEAGGESQKVVEELNMLRTELDKARKELRDSVARQDAELASAHADTEKWMNENSELMQRTEQLSTEYNAVLGRLERTERDNKEKRTAFASLQSQIDILHQREAELLAQLAEKGDEVAASMRGLVRARESTDVANNKFVTLVSEHEELKRKLSRTENEISASLEEQTQLEERAFQLSKEVTTLQGRIRSMHAEHEERMSTERLNLEKEVKKLSEARRELRAAREAVENVQSQLEQKSSEIEKLQRENKEVNDSVQDLIQARVELAMEKERNIRLQNKLKKMTPYGQDGSPSIEF